MSIEFEWSFDDEPETDYGQLYERDTALIVESSPWIVSLLMDIRDSLRHRPYRAMLTDSQRRLHAALARTRPWLCPDALPETVAPNFGWRSRP